MKSFAGLWGSLDLACPPFDGMDPSLQAWNGADRLLAPCIAGSSAANVLILNDAWGALTCVAVAAGKTVLSLGDSRVAFDACRHNLELNRLDPARVHQASLLEDWAGLVRDGLPGLVLLRIPRNLDLFAWQLERLAGLSLPGHQVSVCLAALDRDLVPRCRNLAETWLGPCIQAPGAFKAHLLQASLPPARLAAAPAAASVPDQPGRAGDGCPGQNADWPRLLPVPDRPGLVLANWPGVFSRDGVDPAGLLLLQVLLDGPELAGLGAGQMVVDLGCGNGILALGLARQHPDCRLVLADESAMALASAREGFARLAGMVPGLGEPEYHWTNALAGVADASADVLLCNPPFHLAGRQSLAVSAHLFADARRVLKPGGRFYVVANRHLGHHRNLEAWFAQVQVLADNGKFVVLRASQGNR